MIRLSEIARMNKHKLFQFLYDGHVSLMEYMSDAINANKNLDTFIREFGYETIEGYLEGDYGYENPESMAIYVEMFFSLFKPMDVLIHNIGENTNVLIELNHFKFAKLEYIDSDEQYLILMNENYLT